LMIFPIFPLSAVLPRKQCTILTVSPTSGHDNVPAQLAGAERSACRRFPFHELIARQSS
jgi:hypothetical protein